MRTLLTFDYEIFFGRNTGSVARTLLGPTEALLRVAARHGAKLVFFVDAGFILRLQADMRGAAALRGEHDAICRQVESLARAGHEIQLHIHPHWEDARWEDGWQLAGTRYALHAFDSIALGDIVRRYAAALRQLAGESAARVYRAGGWVIQPFYRLRDALLAEGVCIDSTVYAGGRSESALQAYDFRAAPARSRWRFDDDPLVEAPHGPFLEVPIASRRVAPLFYWQLALARKLGGARHRPLGQGEALAMSRRDLARKLFRASWSVVSADGYKASFLEAAAKDYRRRGLEDFVIIGHPKALTPYSLQRLDEFLASGLADEVATFSAYQPGHPTTEGHDKKLDSSGRRRAA